MLERARRARIALPSRVARPEDLVEIRVTIPDRQRCARRHHHPGHRSRRVSIADIEIAHSIEGDEGVLILLVEAAIGERLQGGLMAHGYRPTLHPIE